jgi:hypothetical protein
MRGFLFETYIGTAPAAYFFDKNTSLMDSLCANADICGMKLFKCPNCNLLLFFENRNCGSCGSVVGYMPLINQLCVLAPDGNGFWQQQGVGGKSYKFCQNAQSDACNWLIEVEHQESFCIACRHNQTVPDLSVGHNLQNWRKMEFAKHRLFYTLLQLGLPLPNRNDDPKRGLAFDFLAESPDKGNILTGHDEGIITIALKEADDVERERARTSMHEPYRTLLGHFRHEIGHYYWDRLVDDENHQDECRALFGDDREDYSQALKRHYGQGAPPNWQLNYVSSYATSHPWEDFAETWAHYLHIVDSLETASSYGLEVHPQISQDPSLHKRAAINPYAPGPFENCVDVWLPITYAMNAMNRSMGLNDAYPFVLSEPVIRKLSFIHTLVHAPRTVQYGGR